MTAFSRTSYSCLLLLILAEVGQAVSPYVIVFAPSGKRGERFKCSGVVIGHNADQTLILTCAHLFDDAVRRPAVKFSDGTEQEAELIAVHEIDDLAAVATKRVEVEKVKIAKTIEGKSLAVYGYGGGDRLRKKSGRLVHKDRWWIKGSKGYTLVTTSQIQGGDSGGAVIDEKGRLVGIVWGFDGHTHATHGEPLVSFVRELKK